MSGGVVLTAASLPRSAKRIKYLVTRIQTKRTQSRDANMGKYVLPLAAAAAIAIAVFLGWGLTNNTNNHQVVNPADQSSSTGGSTGKSGRSTVQNDQTMRSNSGAAAAPTKAPNRDPSAADTRPQP